MSTYLTRRRVVTTVVAVVALSVGSVHAAVAEPQQASPTPYPGGTWEPGPEAYGVQVEPVVMVPMDDGVDIRVQVLRPTDEATGEAATGPFPVLLTQTPYSANLYANRNLPTCDESVPDPVASPCSGDYFVRRGYILVVADQRGTGLSGGGEWTMFDRRQGRDGANLALWAADPEQLPGSAGVVGLYGCSAMGISQLTTAAHLGRTVGSDHPVKAMSPGCIAGSVFRDSYFDNGVPATIAVLSTMEAAIAAHRIPLAVAHGEQPRVQGLDIMAGGDLAYERGFWTERKWSDAAPDIVRSGIPALLYVSWHDGISTVFDLYSQLQNAAAGRPPLGPMTPKQPTTGRYQLFVGDGSHVCCLGDPGVQLQWFDHWLKGEDTGLSLETRTPMHLQDLGTLEYVNAPSYPLTDRYSLLRLGDGTLGEASPADGTDTLAWGPPVDGVSSHSYDSAPLAHGATIAGPLVASLYASSTNSNLQFAAALFDVAPDGTAVEIAHGTLVGSLSDLDPVRSWRDSHGNPVRAYQRLDLDRHKPANTIHRYEVNLPTQLYSVAPGHRLRFTLATQWGADVCDGDYDPSSPTALPVGAPYGCYNTAPQLRSLTGGTYAVQRTDAHPSALSLPLLPLDHFTPVEAGETPTSNGVVVPKDWGRR